MRIIQKAKIKHMSIDIIIPKLIPTIQVEAQTTGLDLYFDLLDKYLTNPALAHCVMPITVIDSKPISATTQTKRIFKFNKKYAKLVGRQYVMATDDYTFLVE